MRIKSSGVSVPLRGIVGIDHESVNSDKLRPHGFRPLAGNCRYRSLVKNAKGELKKRTVSVPLRGIVGIDQSWEPDFKGYKPYLFPSPCGEL